MTPNIHKKLQSIKPPHTSPQTLDNWALVLRILLLLCTIYQLILTLGIPVGKSINALALYSRNLSTAIALAFIGWFLPEWFSLLFDDCNAKTFRLFKLMLLVASVISLAKVIISLLVINTLTKSIDALSYYICDSLAWLALGYLFVRFLQLSIADHHLRNAIRKSRTTSIIIAAAGTLKVLVSAYFTILQFNPHSIVWHYFLADTLSWLTITIFFSIYSYSDFLAYANWEHHHSTTHDHNLQ